MNEDRFSLRDVQLAFPGERERLRDFLRQNNLKLDPSITRYLGAFEGDRLVGGGGYGQNVMRCVAVEPALRGEGIVNAVVSRLLGEMRQSGVDNTFLFTKPENEGSFANLGFHRVEAAGRVLLMETDPFAFSDYLRALGALRAPGNCAAVVVNCNPFTLGHRYLIETAARACDRLFVLVVKENLSEFSFEDRIQMVRAGVRDIGNAYVRSGGDYIISAATFPGYFIHDESEIAGAHARLDATIFARKIAPALGVTARFVGEEPISDTTRMYNRALKEILPDFGIALEEIPRLQIGGAPVSASRVRALLKENALAEIRPLVPESTFRYLTKGKGH